MKISRYLAPLATLSLVSTMALADGPAVLEPILTVPSLPGDSGIVDTHLPPYSTNQIQILLNFNPNTLIRADRGFIRIDLMSHLRDELRRNGYSDQLENYLIQTLQLTAKSNTGEGIARLCAYPYGLNPRSTCDTIVNQYILAGARNQFDDPRSWNTYPLYLSQNPLNLPVDIEVTGYVRISQISITLQVLNSGIVQPMPPIGGPFPGGGHPQFPPSILGRTVVTYNGRDGVWIGDEGRLEKTFTSRNSHLEFFTRNYVFANFSWINIKSEHNASVIDRISVNCLDYNGNSVSLRASDSSERVVENYLLRPNETLTFPISRECAFIEVVKIWGYSPNASGSRARINVNLN